MARIRIDSLLSERGLFESRSRAAASVIAGEVLLGPERRRAQKPGQLVADDTQATGATSIPDEEQTFSVTATGGSPGCGPAPGAPR